MDFDKLTNAINTAVDGFGDAVLSCLEQHSDVVEDIIHEQLYSGLNGEGQHLSPTYDDDPYFKSKQQAEWYKEWKRRITPPESGQKLFLPPRPVEVPNLFINGTFYFSIRTRREAESLKVYTGGFRDGPAIERKYGASIFMIGMEGKQYFTENILKDFLIKYWKLCGL